MDALLDAPALDAHTSVGYVIAYKSTACRRVEELGLYDIEKQTTNTVSRLGDILFRLHVLCIDNCDLIVCSGCERPAVRTQWGSSWRQRRFIQLLYLHVLWVNLQLIHYIIFKCYISNASFMVHCKRAALSTTQLKLRNEGSTWPDLGSSIIHTAYKNTVPKSSMANRRWRECMIYLQCIWIQWTYVSIRNGDNCTRCRHNKQASLTLCCTSSRHIYIEFLCNLDISVWIVNLHANNTARSRNNGYAVCPLENRFNSGIAYRIYRSLTTNRAIYNNYLSSSRTEKGMRPAHDTRSKWTANSRRWELWTAFHNKLECRTI